MYRMYNYTKTLVDYIANAKVYYDTEMYFEWVT